ncbi:sigma-70 family RNA polymerase sigma factor [Clostridium sp. D2Q-14]|uniref:RNA polymerase sigma factor n=1 Tax=Anaeromonas gelatinilytica TaxID=2683194 RepID=UPI00193B4F84|nr:sigma-70 family RNA polymerase sigma factor [Anaeromonas gelatinilytica]MBS4535798.1 sigma-70 family RNA polymerase sigma factor [Anaeromonas gelatinilytica]
MYKKVNELYEKANGGDEFAKEELIEKFRPLILSSMKRYYFNNQEFEDLLQEGFEVIIKGIKDFDKKKGVKFPGYLKTILNFHYLNKLRNNKQMISLNMPIGEDESITLLDTLESEIDIEEEYIKDEETNELYNSLEVLTQRQKEIIILFYVERLKISEIAVKLGISYRTVINIKVQAIEKLRKTL